MNTVFVETYSTYEEYKFSKKLKLSIKSLITYSIYVSCRSEDITLKFIFVDKKDDGKVVVLDLYENDIDFVQNPDIPWQVLCCVYPVALYGNTIVTGLCAVARHICKYKSSLDYAYEHEEGLLGFRKTCLQAPNEVSIWTKFCEIDIINTVQEILKTENLIQIPSNLVRFENHLKKPVRVHNVYKIARDIKKDNIQHSKDRHNIDKVTENTKQNKGEIVESKRISKTRKWKSNTKKELQIDCSVSIKDLKIKHQFAEGPFLTLADLVLLPSYHIIITSLGESICETILPETLSWFNEMNKISQLNSLYKILQKLQIDRLPLRNITVPEMHNVSLYKCDPKRHNPKKRLFTKEKDIESALNTLKNGMELNITSSGVIDQIDWSNIPNGANPNAGHLPDDRKYRKSQQLENLALAVLNIAKEGDLIVDFCSGTGHLGILIAHMLPNCSVILLENNEQSLMRARKRIEEMCLSNVFLFQCNLDFFVGNFNIGVALHACGVATDLVLDKCLNSKAKFILCPCCYGSLHSTDRLVYPRSNIFRSITIDQYLCIGHAADQTHEDHPLSVRGARCMVVIDSDRAHLAKEFGYKVTLSKLKPLNCTPKNNLLIGIPL